jgi:hypothetical protein
MQSMQFKSRLMQSRQVRQAALSSTFVLGPENTQTFFQLPSPEITKGGRSPEGYNGIKVHRCNDDLNILQTELRALGQHIGEG